MSGSSVKQNSNQLVTFKLGDELYGIDIMKVKEIILLGAITRVPSVPEYIEGATNLRGRVIPVIDLRKRLGLKVSDYTEQTRIIVLNLANRTIGVIVDAVSEVLRVHSSEIEETPPGIAGAGREFLRGLVKRENNLLIVLEIEQIIETQALQIATKESL